MDWVLGKHSGHIIQVLPRTKRTMNFESHLKTYRSAIIKMDDNDAS